MTAPNAGGLGVGQPAVADKLIIVGRTDGRKWTTEEIKARLAKDRTARHTGEAIPEDPNQIADTEVRKTLALWKIVAARGVVEALNWPRDCQYQLSFPDGFCLRECTPAVAGSERQLGMYGHMAGCADDFVYRAPCEFVPHVLWLLSESTEHNACPCKPCHRATGRPIVPFVTRLEAEIEALDLANQAEAKPVRKPASKPSTTKRTKPAGTTESVSKAATTTVNTPTRATKKPTTARSSAASKPSQSQSTVTSVSQPGLVATTASPPARHPSWNDEPTLFRRGEMVWCQQIAPSAGWRIGIVREVRPETTANPTPYVVIGLGHSSIEIPDMEREVHHLRPFLTFSVPAISNPLMKDRGFSYVDWEHILSDPQFTRELIGLEASKLAALEVDGSWSTFNQLPAGPKQDQNVSLYGGAFLGAEMIRIGDPIRHKTKSRETLLEVAEISVTENANPSSGQEQSELVFRGVEYEAVLVPEHGKIPVQPQGAIFKKDTAFRTLAAKAGGQKMKCVWQTKLLNTVWMERDVAGRSYATNELLHVTRGEAEVLKAQETGEFQEASSFLNHRLQAIGSLDHGRKPNRWATYSQAVHVARQQLRLGDDITED